MQGNVVVKVGGQKGLDLSTSYINLASFLNLRSLSVLICKKGVIMIVL